MGIGVAQLNTEGFCDGIVLPVRTARVGARAANQAGNSRAGGQLLGGVLPHTRLPSPKHSRDSPDHVYDSRLKRSTYTSLSGNSQLTHAKLTPNTTMIMARRRSGVKSHNHAHTHN